MEIQEKVRQEVPYSAAKLVQHIEDVIEPKNDTFRSIEDLIEHAMSSCNSCRLLRHFPVDRFHMTIE